MTKYPGYPNATHYSPNFSKAEMDCHCGCPTPPDVAANLVITAGYAEQWRSFSGMPFIVDDAYRCATQNAKVGGVPHSQHIQGKAIDRGANEQTAAGVDFLGAKALGVPAYVAGGTGRYYNGHGFFVHADWDTNPATRPAHWSET